jgi:hypothetical protein
MILEPTSILYTIENGRRARLSYVFEDDDRFRVGLTSSWLSPSLNANLAFGEQKNAWPAIFHGAEAIGHISTGPIGKDYARDLTRDPGPSILRAGILTCTFTLNDAVQVSDQFRNRSEGRIEKIEGIISGEAYILGEGPVGRMLDDLEHLEIEKKTIYPLLRLERSTSDFSRSETGVRNGAMVTTSTGSLIGVIVGRSKDSRVYCVAPILDVLDWHRLNFASQSDGDGDTDASVGRQISVDSSHNPERRGAVLPQKLDRRVVELVGD